MPNMNMPTISVIIPHLNQPESLDACLSSLDSQTLDHSLFDIIVVDNGSTLAPHAVIARHPRTRLLHESKPGPGMARNTGVQASNGDVLAFIDADCRAHPDWLRSAVNAFSRLPEQSVLGGDVQIWREANTKITAIEAYEAVFAYRFQLYIERHGYSGTGNLIVRRSAFEKIGPFKGIQVAEDMDWGTRACTAGYTFHYVPEMIVYHPSRKSIHELFVKWDRHTQHYLNMASGRPAWRIRWIVRAIAVLASPAFDWITVVSTNRISGASAHLKAFIVLVAVRSYRAWKMLSLLKYRNEVFWNRGDNIGQSNTTDKSA